MQWEESGGGKAAELKRKQPKSAIPKGNSPFQNITPSVIIINWQRYGIELNKSSGKVNKLHEIGIIFLFLQKESNMD